MSFCSSFLFASSCLLVMNQLEREYDHGRKWPLSRIEAKGWRLLSVRKQQRTEPHTYIVEGEWEEFVKDGRRIKYFKAKESDVVREDIVYNWSKDNFYCSHVKSFNPYLILN